MKKLFTILSVFGALASFAQPNRTAVLTGNVATDFTAVEKSNPYSITWDTKNIYIGVTGGGTFIKDEPTLVYLDTLGSGGNGNGFNYDGRKAILPFTANAVIYFKNGYAEFRRDSAAGFDGWSNRKVATDSVKTGTNDIEIKISWKDLFGSSKVPKSFAAFFYKNNNNAAQSDAYFVRPGVGDKNDDYSSNVQTEPISLYYRFTTQNKFYNNISVFSSIVGKVDNLCTAPGVAINSETNKTATSLRVNWVKVPDAVQYQVRWRNAGTTTWKNKLVAGSASFTLLSGLTCATNYNWVVRSLCDTTGTVDIGSAFSAERTFNLTCFGPRGINSDLIEENTTIENVVVYPVPARKGSRITVGSQEFRNNAGFSLISFAGKQVQQGIVNNGALNLSNSVPAGTYILELRNTNTVVRKKIIVMQ